MRVKKHDFNVSAERSSRERLKILKRHLQKERKLHGDERATKIVDAMVELMVSRKPTLLPKIND